MEIDAYLKHSDTNSSSRSLILTAVCLSRIHLEVTSILSYSLGKHIARLICLPHLGPSILLCIWVGNGKCNCWDQIGSPFTSSNTWHLYPLHPECKIKLENSRREANTRLIHQHHQPLCDLTEGKSEHPSHVSAGDSAESQRRLQIMNWQLETHTHTPRSRLWKQHEFFMKSHEVWTERGKESCFYKRIKEEWIVELTEGNQALWSLNTAQFHRQPGQKTLPNAWANQTKSVCVPQTPICCWNRGCSELMCRAIWCFWCVTHTTGSHPSIILAFRMSGLLLWGSSWASGRNWIWLRLTVEEGTD